ncbi:Fur family transcriptional regulator [Peredibacter sp. HCB2-198]|uniref:Fur family transcriptional regulator n=1 Tax=Peredibacter sp. HCB2-198 TaxID=3383025 RepID=UPI0038B4FE83
MKKHRDLVSILKAKNLRLTPARRALIQYILDNKSKHISLKEIYEFLGIKVEGVNRSSVYRNIELLKKLDIIQELNLPNKGKCFQYVFDKDVHHFYICKTCGKASRGNKELFEKIEKALKDIHGFSKANLSMVFYGFCEKCKGH